MTVLPDWRPANPTRRVKDVERAYRLAAFELDFVFTVKVGDMRIATTELGLMLRKHMDRRG